MDFFKAKRFGRYLKSTAEKGPDAENRQAPEEVPKPGNGAVSPKGDGDDSAADLETDGEEEEGDDFIMNEVKRRLRELKKNSCMVLIPEEPCPEGEEEEEEVEEGERGLSSRQWRESEVEDVFPWCGFSTLYGEYGERMLFFERIIAQHSQNAEHRGTERAAASRRLVSGYRRLSFKRRDQLAEESQRLHQRQDEAEESLQSLEMAYAAHLSLTWEALHCQYTQLRQKTLVQADNSLSYCSSAQAFQQFQVLLQRFVENEPFEPGSRAEIYARARLAMPKLLQVPSFQGLELEDKERGDMDSPVLAADLLKAIGESVLIFRLFLKAEKAKASGGATSVARHGCAAALQQARTSLSKREMKLKELLRKRKGWKKQSSSWPAALEDVELLFGLIDLRVVSRVLRMVSITREQVLWCEEKMSKLGFSESKLQRDGAPLLFPC
ncbi:unnamed protein product [Spirodela intermedia]|uniref:Uncharacterized protein n=1 Tax=Spirodela intermedia TaxID=51605 RepID=A0A7I8LBL7_SPIIN|nr:unnamed protein product [Spirodela intermedia]